MREVLGKTHKTMLNNGCDMWAPEFKTPNRNSHNHDIDFDYIYYLYRLQIRNFRDFLGFSTSFQACVRIATSPLFSSLSNNMLFFGIHYSLISSSSKYAVCSYVFGFNGSSSVISVWICGFICIFNKIYN